MKGDFSRLTFDAQDEFTSVLVQQGRVLVDADFNEQAAIFSHALRALARDILGDHGGRGEGFRVDRWNDGDDVDVLALHPGRYYVDGLPCDNDRRVPLVWF